MLGDSSCQVIPLWLTLATSKMPLHKLFVLMMPAYFAMFKRIIRIYSTSALVLLSAVFGG